MMVDEIRVAAVLAKKRPLRDDPALKATLVATRKMPSRCEVVPASKSPATYHTMLEAFAPPARKTFAPLPSLTLPEVWKMKRSSVPVQLPSVHLTSVPVRMMSVRLPCFYSCFYSPDADNARLFEVWTTRSLLALYALLGLVCAWGKGRGKQDSPLV
jgi:hypothetical protein